MKKLLGLLVLLILFAVSFGAGARFHQQKIRPETQRNQERQILHYVDPMNPAHTATEPGIAPCGMPMEPVYADQDTLSGSGGTSRTSLSSPGSVRVPLQKQQIVGVQIGEVTKTEGTGAIRALGRITPEENRIYTLIAASDGWLEDIHEATTGSLVSENQLLAQIKIYSYDFFTWQQRYLTELGYTNRLNLGTTPLSTSNQSRRRMMSGAGYEAGLPIPESQARLIKREAVIAQMGRAAKQQEREQLPPADESMPGSGTTAANEAGPHRQADANQVASQMQSLSSSEIDHAAHLENMAQEDGADKGGAARDNNLLYSSKGWLELLNFGVEESQITALADNGVYITHVDIRSPVNGYVLTRNVSPRQKIDRGAECFRIVDLAQVWVEADIYGIEMDAITPGMMARVSLPNQKKSVTAIVSEIPPRFDPVSRSLKVRLMLENPERIFRPDMFVDVEFLVKTPESIAVPAGAVIDTGTRKTVYVVKEEGIFEPREVATGWQLNDQVEIVDGLQPGEKIVISGNFLIDSESRMKLAALRLMEDTAQRRGKEQPDPVAAPPVATATATPASQPAQPPIAPVEKSKDPVCGMTVRHDTASADDLTFEADGKTYFFCSADCKEQFKQAPQRFLGESTGEHSPKPSSVHGSHHHD